LAAKLKKKNQLTKKNEEKMKKLMLVIQVIFSAIIAGLVLTYTISSLFIAGLHSYHVALALMSLLAACLVYLSVTEYVQFLNEQ
jgi:hypothetical protein